MKQTLLWYGQPANAWEEALPLGNGRIGAMDFGGVADARIALNEDTLWSGYPRDTNIDGAGQYLDRVQQLILEGRQVEAAKCVEDNMLGPYTQSYLPLGDMMLAFDGLGTDVSDYRRQLSLDDALSVTTFTEGGAMHRRELFVSHPHQALLMRLSTDAAGGLSLRVGLQSQLRAQASANGNVLTLRGIAPSFVQPSYIDDPNPVIYDDAPERRGMRFCVMVRATATGGRVEAGDCELVIRGANEVVLELVARTSFHGYERQPFVDGLDEGALALADLCGLDGMGFDAVRAAHVADHQALYGRAEIELGGPDYSAQDTGERLRQYSMQQDDRGLIGTLFQYGRYLTIAASRPGTQAMNLQGIWNQELRAPWSSNYTININTQMNYWPTESVALPELAAPLFDLIADLRRSGAQTAAAHYGARGAVAHHNTDLWRLSNPVGNRTRGTSVYAMWPMSFGWLCEHLFEHYQFTRDAAFLREWALPAIRDAARFYLDVLRENASGYLSVFPATSPENVFYLDGERCAVAGAATMSNAIVREVFQNYLSILDILSADEPMADAVRGVLPRIHPYEIGTKGQLLEWDREYPEVEPHHRHTSHLYALHPSRQISDRSTPQLADACRRTLALRGDDGTGWSLGWKINFWARLGDGDHALKQLKMQLRYVDADEGTNYGGGGGSYLNLFGAHPPFQIDGNFGACAGISEMLLQSDGDEIWLLPALPGEWDAGYVRGLRAHGGMAVDIEYANGELVRARLCRVASCDTPMTVRYRGMAWTITLEPGEAMEIVPVRGAK